jgi:A/G-specific adenine glycosylase
MKDDPRRPDARERLWQRAEELLPEKGVGDFNSALMELGATICTPRSPKCSFCPVKVHCEALSAGVVELIPPAPAAKIRPIERRLTLAIARGPNTPAEQLEWLIEQRPPRGRWASMWQFVTVEATEARPTAQELSKLVGVRLSDLRRIGELRHDLTHRRYEFEILTARVKGTQKAPEPDESSPATRRWVGLEGLSDYPLPAPHVQVAQMISSIIRR